MPEKQRLLTIIERNLIMWKNKVEKFESGDPVWARGCRDVLITGVVVSVTGSSAQVRMNDHVWLMKQTDLIKREEKT